MSGGRFAAMIQAGFCIALATLGGIYLQWKMGLVGSLFVPFVLIGSWVQAKVMTSHDNVERGAMERGSKVSLEKSTKEAVIIWGFRTQCRTKEAKK